MASTSHYPTPPISQGSRPYPMYPPPPSSTVSHASASDGLPPNPYLQRKNFPLFSALIESPEYLATIATIPASRHRSPHYASYKEDSTDRRRSATAASSSKSRNKARPPSSRSVASAPPPKRELPPVPSLPPLPTTFQQPSTSTNHRPRDSQRTLSAEAILSSNPVQERLEYKRKTAERLSRDWDEVSNFEILSEVSAEGAGVGGKGEPSRAAAGNHLFSSNVFEMEKSNPPPLAPRHVAVPTITTDAPKSLPPIHLKSLPNSPGSSNAVQPSTSLDPSRHSLSGTASPLPNSIRASKSFSQTLGSLKRMLSEPRQSSTRPVSAAVVDHDEPIKPRNRRWSIVVPRAASPTSIMSYEVDNTSFVIVGDNRNRRSSSGTTLTSLYNGGTASSVSSDPLLSKVLNGPANESSTTLPMNLLPSSPIQKPKPFPTNPFIFDEISQYPSPPPMSAQPGALDFPPLAPTKSLPDLPTTYTRDVGIESKIPNTYESYGSKWEVGKTPKAKKEKELPKVKISSKAVWKKWIVWVNEARVKNGESLAIKEKEHDT